MSADSIPTSEPQSSRDGEPAPGRRNPLGAFVLFAGIAVLLLDGALSLGQIGLLGAGDTGSVQIYGVVTLVLRGILGIGVTLLGVVALVIRGTSKPFAAAGTALGGAILFGAIVGALYPVVASIAYR